MDQETISQAREVKDRISGAASEQIGRGVGAVQEKLREFAEAQKHRGAEQLRGLANAAHRAAADMETQSPLAAKYLHQAATGIEGASEGLRERSFEELAEALERFARERPAMLFAGAMLTGFALTWLIAGRSRS